MSCLRKLLHVIYYVQCVGAYFPRTPRAEVRHRDVAVNARPSEDLDDIRTVIGIFRVSDTRHTH